jgi:glycosyltransferase involved in cell wall biosynthesis
MSEVRLASIIITSYNYGRYLNEAIDSAINQTYPNVEVVVVDDGSADNSREVIAGYESQVIPVLKENGGQASAFNAGFAMSHGEFVFFLDSDDALLPQAVANVVRLFDEPGVMKVHWPLWIINEHGRKTQKVKEPKLPEGDFRHIVQTKGPMTEATLPSAPTSGNAYARTFLRQVLPMPEPAYRISADAYLFGLAPAFGKIRRIMEPQGFWRFHGQNASKGTRFEERVRIGMSDYEQQCLVLTNLYRDKGINIDVENWKANSWWPRIDRAIEEIATLIPEGDSFILADGDGWGTDEFIAGHRRIPFVERDGRYWGAPADDADAIEELDRLRQSGANFIVFGWPAFWWLEHYTHFYSHLRARYPCVLQNDRLVAFDLQCSRK